MSRDHAGLSSSDRYDLVRNGLEVHLFIDRAMARLQAERTSILALGLGTALFVVLAGAVMVLPPAAQIAMILGSVGVVAFFLRPADLLLLITLGAELEGSQKLIRDREEGALRPSCVERTPSRNRRGSRTRGVDALTAASTASRWRRVALTPSTQLQVEKLKEITH